MLTVLENEFLRVCVTSKGAELQSIVGKADGTEYLWQGDEIYWSCRATVIFPVCGRTFGGSYLYRGKRYEMGCHGLARYGDFTVTEKSATSVSLHLTDSEETRRIYPFAFSLTVTYTLTGNELTTAFLVENTGDDVLPFAEGGHPGFNVPFVPGTTFEDYRLTFSAPSAANRRLFSETCYSLGKTAPFALENGTTVPLRHSLFDSDAVFLTDTAKEVTLKCDASPRSITVKFDDFDTVGFWHKPKTEAPYVCIEPWNGIPTLDGTTDDFATKEPMKRLAPGGSYRSHFSFVIEQS